MDQPTPEPEPQPPQRKPLRKRLGRLALSVLFILTCVFGFVTLAQGKLIWPGRVYRSHDRLGMPESIVELPFHTSQGKQLAFYLPPRTGEAPRAVWVMFSGNAMAALDWRWLVKSFPEEDIGFLLVDYPGYGKCHGKASPETAQENALAAFAELENLLSEDLPPRLGILGFSIGTGTALNFAAAEPRTGRVILIAPFSTLEDLVASKVGRPFTWVLHHQFDNLARLGELAARETPPRVEIYHGASDSIIPPRHSEPLAAKHPEIVTRSLLSGAGHNDLIDRFQREIQSAMKWE